MQTTQATKQELKHWIDSVDDDITLLLLQSLKKATSLEDWFWDNISIEQKQHIIESLKKAKENGAYSQQELWKEIEYQYSPENMEEVDCEGLRQALRQSEEDFKAGRYKSSEEVWKKYEHRL